jgi:hypothetical protein
MVKYSLEQSPLFQMGTLGTLGRLLKLDSPRVLLELERQNKISPERFYHRHPVGKRDVQALRGRLGIIHRRLYGLLSRLATPPYLTSSQSGLSYVDNARIHQNPNLSVLSLDITKFFARTRHSAVLRFFLHRLQMATDLAHLLANLCCYQGKRLPLGSPISQPMAFWANESMFREIAAYAEERDLTLSIYIDDLAISSKSPLSKECHRDIQAILNAHGMTIHWRKIRYRPAGQPKVITGCLVTSAGELDAPAELKKKTLFAVRRFRSHPTVVNGERALGLVHAVRAIVPDAFEKERAELRADLRRLRETGRGQSLFGEANNNSAS